MCFGYSNIVSLQAFGFGLGNVKFSRVSSWRCRLWGLFFAIYSLSAYALMHKVEIDCYCNMIVQLVSVKHVFLPTFAKVFLGMQMKRCRCRPTHNFG